MSEYKKYGEAILQGDMAALSKAITWVESSNDSYRAKGREIIEYVLPYTGKSFRIGVTGAPGVGKSSWIDAIGHLILQSNKKVAVLAVDPSSSRNKGSILGDKTRMERLSKSPAAFVRPTPSSLSLGGVAQATRESIFLCEAAGYDIILVETVGVGQSEVEVKSMVDCLVLLLSPGAGDELQGIKRGIMEEADVLFINKAEGNNVDLAKETAKQYRNALHLFPMPQSGIEAKVGFCSAIAELNIKEAWEELVNFEKGINRNGFFRANRKKQLRKWLDSLIEWELKKSFIYSKDVNAIKEEVIEMVETHKMTAYSAAKRLIHAMRKE